MVGSGRRRRGRGGWVLPVFFLVRWFRWGLYLRGLRRGRGEEYEW